MLFTKQGILELYAATHGCLDVLIQHIADGPDGLLSTEVPGFGRSTIAEQLAHIASVEAAWVCGLQCLAIQRFDARECRTIRDVRGLYAGQRAATSGYIGGLSESQLNSKLSQYPDDWIGPEQTPAFILLHVITHAFHHKGQIAAMLRLLGRPAPDTDVQRE